LKFRTSGWLAGVAWTLAAAWQPAIAADLQCPRPEAWQTAQLSQLASYFEACEENALFQAHKGAMLLADGQIELAAIALEKALLLRPDLPGAQLDYAQALAQIGLKGSARALLQEVLRRPDIQPDLKAKLTQPESPLNKTAGFADATSWSWNALVQSTAGRESNLNSATYSDYLTLWLSNGPVNLALADTAKPIAGTGLKTQLAVQGQTPLGAGELGISTLLASKNSPKHPEGDNRSLEGAVKYSLPMQWGQNQAAEWASGHWQAALGGTHFWVGSVAAYTDQSAQLKYIWNTMEAPCRLAPGFGLMTQVFPQSTSLNGNYRFSRLELTCANGGSHETQLSLGSGTDKATDPMRPGGDKSRSDLIFRHERLIKGGQLTLLARYTQNKDQLNYSELLGELKTITRRQDISVSYWLPLTKRWSAGLNVETTSQKSNNSLFNLKNSALYAGIRWSNT